MTIIQQIILKISQPELSNSSQHIPPPVSRPSWLANIYEDKHMPFCLNVNASSLIPPMVPTQLVSTLTISCLLMMF